MKVSEFEIEVERKQIKNVHLAVYPPDGRVHISVPEHLTDWDISTFLYSKLGWIRKQYNEVITQYRQSPRDYVTGESHYLFGERYLLQIIPTKGTSSIEATPTGLDMHIKPHLPKSERAALLFAFYHRELTAVLDELMRKWRRLMGEEIMPVKYEIDMVIRKWGQCYQSQRRIVFSLLLARVPRRCIEYVVVHELAHLKVREHDERFTAILDHYLPDWQSRKQDLDNFPALPIPQHLK